MLELHPALSTEFSGDDAFERILDLDGETFRCVEGRRTLRFEVNGRGYFVKVHTGAGWKEIFKNLIYLRLPVLGAGNERRAIEKLHQLGVETMTIAGFGEEGINPAKQRSFLITEELHGTISLEDFCRDWPAAPPAYPLRKALVEKVADVARTLHGNGVNHRDFYLCHFLLQLPLLNDVRRPDQLQTYLIDLHRVQIRSRTPRRWVVKDVAGLYFSCLDIGLTPRDVWRFMRRYSGQRLSDTLRSNRSFWAQVSRRAVRLYLKDFGRKPNLPV